MGKSVETCNRSMECNGQWIRFKGFEDDYYHIKCSECGQYWSDDEYAKIFKYCFNCGVRMEMKNERM